MNPNNAPTNISNNKLIATLGIASPLLQRPKASMREAATSQFKRRGLLFKTNQMECLERESAILQPPNLTQKINISPLKVSPKHATHLSVAQIVYQPQHVRNSSVLKKEDDYEDRCKESHAQPKLNLELHEDESDISPSNKKNPTSADDFKKFLSEKLKDIKADQLRKYKLASDNTDTPSPKSILRHS